MFSQPSIRFLLQEMSKFITNVCELVIINILHFVIIKTCKFDISRMIRDPLCIINNLSNEIDYRYVTFTYNDTREYLLTSYTSTFKNCINK